MAIDKSKNKQVLITLSHEMIERIEDYQHANKISNRNQAVRELLEKGLESK